MVKEIREILINLLCVGDIIKILTRNDLMSAIILNIQSDHILVSLSNSEYIFNKENIIYTGKLLIVDISDLYVKK